MRTFSKILGLASMSLALGVLAAPAAFATIPESSALHVTAPLDVGGTVLEPGEYRIHVLPSILNRNMLRVTSVDGSEVYTTVMSIPHARGIGEDKAETAFVYYPATEGAPRALRTWFAADSTSGGGHDIVYPKRRAMELAAALDEPVIAYSDETTAEQLESADLVTVTPEMEVTPYEEPAPEAQATTRVASYTELPQTASRVPLFGLIGLAFLGLAIGLHTYRAV